MVVIKDILKFAYDPSKPKYRFRSWLFTIAKYKASEAMRRAKLNRTTSIDATESDDEQSLAETLASDDPDARDVLEKQWRQCLLEEAWRRIQEDPQTKPKTLAAFRAYVIEEQPAEVVAKQFGLEENAVFAIKHRVIKRLQDEVREMENFAATQQP